MPHFSAMPAEIETLLERDADGVIPYSLANVLRMRRPVLIIDEASCGRTVRNSTAPPGSTSI